MVSKATTQNDEGSALAKLQTVVQMLGVINSDLTTLATTIAATERVNTSLAATDDHSAAIEQLRAAARQLLVPSARDQVG